jgi:putative flippase GtrA
VTCIVEVVRDLFLSVTRRPEVRYLVVGGLNTAFSYALFTVALLILHGWGVPGDYAIAITFSWIISNLTSYLLQRRFVFERTRRPIREFVKFTSVTFGSFLANLALSWFSVSVLGFDDAVEKLVSQLIVTVVLVVATYVLHRSFSFRERDAEPVGMTGVLEDHSDAPQGMRSAPGRPGAE